MKKITLILGLLLLSTSVFAAVGESQRIKLSNKNYELKFSNCEKDSKVCLNEYYRLRENGTNWSELVTIHYFKNQNDVMKYAEKLANVTPFSQLFYNQQKDEAIVIFMLPYYKVEKNAMEQNIFRIQKHKTKKGLTAIQFAHRHPFDTEEERSKLQDTAQKIQEKYTGILAEIEIPDMIMEPLKKW